MWQFILDRPWVWIPSAGILLIDAIYNIWKHTWGPAFAIVGVIVFWIIIPWRVVAFVVRRLLGPETNEEKRAHKWLEENRW